MWVLNENYQPNTLVAKPEVAMETVVEVDVEAAAKSDDKAVVQLDDGEAAMEIVVKADDEAAIKADDEATIKSDDKTVVKLEDEAAVKFAKLSSSTQPAQSQTSAATLDNNPASPEVDRGTFPFMRLPLELRIMVYKEVLVQPTFVNIGDVRSDIQSRNHFCKAASVQSLHHPESGLYVGAKNNCQRPVVQLFLTSKIVYCESTSVYFAFNTFSFNFLHRLPPFIGTISASSRRSVRSVQLRYAGKAPAKTFKLLTTCTGLRWLHLIVNLDTPYLMNVAPYCLMNTQGLRALLKVRGIETLMIERNALSHPTSQDCYYRDLKEFREALQVLKNPHDPATLARLKKMDSLDKLHRSIYGNGNAADELKKPVMSTNS